MFPVAVAVISVNILDRKLIAFHIALTFFEEKIRGERGVSMHVHAFCCISS